VEEHQHRRRIVPHDAEREILEPGSLVVVELA
jgi:hypothetical protein